MNQKSTINNILNQIDNSKNIGVEINDNIVIYTPFGKS